MEKVCKTCKWFEPWPGVPEDDEPEEGDCNYPSERLPLAAKYATREYIAVEAQSANCPCWEAKS